LYSTNVSDVTNNPSIIIGSVLGDGAPRCKDCGAPPAVLLILNVGPRDQPLADRSTRLCAECARDLSRRLLEAAQPQAAQFDRDDF
jgi:hypothetical protein